MGATAHRATQSLRPADVVSRWYVIDAEDQVLGRLSTRVATVLRGKHRPDFTPHVDHGDGVIVVNAEKARLTGRELENKLSQRHSGYVGSVETRTAAEVLARLPQRDLGHIPGELGGERFGRRVAAAICAERRREPIRTTGRLASIVRRTIRGRGRIDAATRTFQALRMAVNDELDQLAAGLDAAASRLRPGGRLLSIAFHSGEDRIAKRFLKDDPRLAVLTKKVVRPGAAETRTNRRARSARLRVAERKQDA